MIGGNAVWGNGVLLRRQGAGEVTLRVVRKDVVVGSEVAQSSWNVDRFDGAGPSQITVDWTKSQILVVDLQALYVGRVRVGLQIDGVLYLAHEFHHANVQALPYLASANLAPWYAIENTGIAASGSSLLQICAEVSREGGDQELAEVVGVGTEVGSPAAIGTTLGFGFVGGATAAARGLTDDKGLSDRVRLGFGLSGASDVFVVAGVYDAGASNSVNCALRVAELE